MNQDAGHPKNNPTTNAAISGCGNDREPRLCPFARSKRRKISQWMQCLTVWSAVSLVGPAGQASVDGSCDEFVRVSPRDSRYFELSDGTPYIPIGLNLATPNWNWNQTELDRMAWMEHWIRSLAANGGNFARVWIGHPFWDIEHEEMGLYDPVQVRKVGRLMELARETGVRIKFCMEQYCRIEPLNPKGNRNKAIYHVSEGGEWESLNDYLQSDSGRDHFRSKIAWYDAHFGDEPMIFAWELWNEMDAVAADKQVWMDWTEAVFPDLDRAFPRNLLTQSMGSFDYVQRRDRHRWQGSIPENDIVQVHRYIDLGAGLDVCKGPVDVMAADAIREMRAFDLNKPILLAETGGVQPKHAGPFEYYKVDTDGTILHDVLFAPFFAGAAGPGHIWFWDSYVDPMDLWYHFDRFSEAIEGIDPPAEQFEPLLLEISGVRVYLLKGKHTSLVWCRDAANTWETELRDGLPPRVVDDLILPMAQLISADSKVSVRAYDPWKSEWLAVPVADAVVTVPGFRRSIVIRLSNAEE